MTEPVVVSNGVLPYLPQRRSKAALIGASKAGHKKTVIFALVANLIIAVAKLCAGLFSGSSSMLSEAGHSFADSFNQVLLGMSLISSKQPADPAHPFGYGRARFLWAFLAALASFLIGGCVSIGLGIWQLTHPSIHEGVWISGLVLAIAFLADGASWLQSVRQTREMARDDGKTFLKYLRTTSDPILRAIVVEDSASLIGILLSGAGLLLSHLTGSSTPDAIASLLIGALLTVTALGLANPLADYLIGRTLPEPMLKEIAGFFAECPVIEELIGLHASFIGPEEVLVVAKIRPKNEMIQDLAKAMDDLDHRIREHLPIVADVFVDVTAARPAPIPSGMDSA